MDCIGHGVSKSQHNCATFTFNRCSYRGKHRKKTERRKKKKKKNTQDQKANQRNRFPQTSESFVFPMKGRGGFFPTSALSCYRQPTYLQSVALLGVDGSPVHQQVRPATYPRMYQEYSMTGGGLRMNSLGLSPPSFTESSMRTSPSTVLLIFPSGLLSSHACAESSLLGSCSDVSGSLLSPSLFGNRSQFIEHSVQFSRSVVSDSLRSHELQHTRPPCPSPTPGVHSGSCPSSP